MKRRKREDERKEGFREGKKIQETKKKKTKKKKRKGKR